MPEKVEIDSVNQVTGSYKVEDWSETKKQWPHLLQCEFPKPATDDLADLLIGVDNAELLYSKVDVHGPPGSPTARLGQLGWTGIDWEVCWRKIDLIMHSFFSKDARINKATESCCDVSSTLRKY